MADLLLDTEGTPPAPSASKLVVYPDSGSKQLTTRNDAGLALSLGGLTVASNIADVVANAADTYLTGSMVNVPQHLLQAGTVLKWRFGVTKTAAGVASPVWLLRVGTAGSIADVSRCTFTSLSAQTAAVDAGFIEITAVLRNTGAAGVLAGILMMIHNGNTLGLASSPIIVVQNTSAGFDTTVANLKIGISVNPGAAGVWTHQVIVAEMTGI